MLELFSQIAFEAVKLVSKWKEIRFDVRLPQTNGDVSHVSEDGQTLHIKISQENFQEITLNKEKWLEIAAQLEYKQIKDYVIHRKNK
jgi:adenylate cyclase class IV